MLNINIANLRKYIDLYCFEFESFKDLMNNILYNTELPPDEQPSKELGERLELFEDIFIKSLCLANSTTIHIGFGSEISISDLTLTLYRLLLYDIFNKLLKEDIDFEKKVQLKYQEWQRAVKNNLIEIILIIPMPNIFSNKDYTITDNKIYIKRNNTFHQLKTNGIKGFQANSQLVIKKQIPLYIYSSRKEFSENKEQNQKKLFEEWSQMVLEVQEIVCTLYLNGIHFKYEEFLEQWAWFIGKDIEYYEKLEEKLSRKSKGERISITDNQIKDIVNLYPLVVISEFFKNEDYIIIYHNYMQLFTRDYTPDVILDVFILFEFFFARNVHTDINFWLAFNAGLFLADNEVEFLKIFVFFKRYYHIRSALVHGSEWHKKLKNFLKKDYGSEVPNILLRAFKEYLNKSLTNIIKLKQLNPDILNDIHNLHEKENLEKKFLYILRLVSYYEKIEEYSISIKILIEALKISLELKDNNKEKECYDKFIEIYSKKRNIIAFTDEFKKVKQELEILSNINDPRKINVQEALQKIDLLLKFQPKIVQEIQLEITGFEIMELSGLSPGSKIGEIKSHLKELIKKGELINNKSVLENFILNNY